MTVIGGDSMVSALAEDCIGEGKAMCTGLSFSSQPACSTGSEPGGSCIRIALEAPKPFRSRRDNPLHLVVKLATMDIKHTTPKSDPHPNARAACEATKWAWRASQPSSTVTPPTWRLRRSGGFDVLRSSLVGLSGLLHEFFGSCAGGSVEGFSESFGWMRSLALGVEMAVGLFARPPRLETSHVTDSEAISKAAPETET